MKFFSLSLKKSLFKVTISVLWGREICSGHCWKLNVSRWCVFVSLVLVRLRQLDCKAWVTELDLIAILLENRNSVLPQNASTLYGCTGLWVRKEAVDYAVFIPFCSLSPVFFGNMSTLCFLIACAMYEQPFLASHKISKR